MLRWLRETWAGSAPVEFESAFGLADSVARLRAATKRSIFSSMAQEAAVGTVTAERVSLQRVIPMVGNAFKPFFVGRFVESGGSVKLHGRFKIHWFTKLFWTVWFGGLASIGLLASATILRQPRGWIVPLAALGMLAAGLGFVRSGQWFSRRDPAWLSEIIGTALGTPSILATAAVRAPRAGLPGHILPFVGLLVFGGLQMGGFGLAGIEGLQFDGYGFVPSQVEDDSLQRYLPILFGGLMLVWAYGIYRQYRLAWWVGIGLFVLGGVDILTTLTSAATWIPAAGAPQPLMMLQLLGGPLVLAVWAWWWYAQRRHFRN